MDYLKSACNRYAKKKENMTYEQYMDCIYDIDSALLQRTKDKNTNEQLANYRRFLKKGTPKIEDFQNNIYEILYRFEALLKEILLMIVSSNQFCIESMIHEASRKTH